MERSNLHSLTALWNLGSMNLYLHSTHCLQQSPSHDQEVSTEHTPSSVVVSLCYHASLSLVKHCESQATKSHHVLVPLFLFAYLNRPTLTMISVSASTDVTIHCKWGVPGVQQIDTASFLAEEVSASLPTGVVSLGARD